MVPIHIFIFLSELWPMCDLDLCGRDLNVACDTLPHNSDHLCQVILKSFYACKSFAPDKCFSMTSKCDLDLWPRGLVHVRDTAAHSGEHFYEVSLKFLHEWRRYAPDKNWTPQAQAPGRAETIIQPVFQMGV
jgi:hypothetical protein